MRSKREMREGGKLMFSTTDFLGSYLESTGLAAASTLGEGGWGGVGGEVSKRGQMRGVRGGGLGEVGG